jgi:hypothetical protein
MARLRVAGPKRTVADEMKVTSGDKKRNREKSLRAVKTTRRSLRLTIAERLVTRNQLLMPRNPLFVGKALENEILWLPLQNVRHLTAQIVEQGFTDIGPMADVHPFVRAAEAVDSGLFGCVAHRAGPVEEKPLMFGPLHEEVLFAVSLWHWNINNRENTGPL